MKYLLFFGLGVIIGGFFMTVIMCALQIEKTNSLEEHYNKNE